MDSRLFGKTGLQVTRLGFGAMRLPEDEELAIQCMQRYLDLGGNYIDTARCYGESERRVGEAIKGRRDQMILATKNHAIARARWDKDFTWDDAVFCEMMEESFTTLGVDYLDLYFLHDITHEGFLQHFDQRGGAYRAVRKALDEGTIRHLCFSAHEAPEGIHKLIDEGLFAGMLVQYNLMNRANEECLAHAAEAGMGVVIMGPVGGGRLAAPSEKLAEVSGIGYRSLPELALRFVLANPAVTLTISGMNSLEMVEENVATAARQDLLSAEELARLNQVVAEFAELAKLYCTGCRYCLPCPQGVAIPEIFELMNNHRVWGMTEAARRRYAQGLAKDNPEGRRNAEACVECGECEAKCPQHIPIMAQLKESHAALAG